MKILITIICGFAILLFAFMLRKKSFDSAVRAAVERQMEHYPQSTLKDIYKNFFQDKFGPGHIVSDTASAGNYLREELASYDTIQGEVAEPLGWEKKYLRVNLSVVKQGIVPYPVYFDSFIRSVNGIEPMPVVEWISEWNRIEAVIASMQLSLPDYETDKAAIAEHLKQGNYVGHHSQAYEEAYRPHYRIMSRKLFDKELLPLLKAAGFMNKNE